MRLLTMCEVTARLGGRSRSTIYADLAAGRLPQPVKIGGRVYWREADLSDFIANLPGQQQPAGNSQPPREKI